MKKITKLFMLLLALIISLTLFACGESGDGDKCDECIDDDNSGTCDVCGEKMLEEQINDISLIDNGFANFKIVFASDLSSDVRKVVNQKIVAKLRKDCDIEVIALAEGSDNDAPQDVEVLIGEVTSRGEKYSFDRYSLGEEGYMIKIVGTKVLISAGSDEALEEAVLEFAENILKIDTDDVYYATMTKDDIVYNPQDDYKIKSVTVSGADMRGYTIAVDSSNATYNAAAIFIRDTFYSKTGYYFKLVGLDEATDKSIILKNIDKISGDDSFTIKVDGTRLVISCAYDNMLEQAIGEFLTQYVIIPREESINFLGSVYKQDISVVYYEDFGAVGDGKTDDFRAIWDTHRFANECGQTVKSKNPDATYYLFNTVFVRPGKKNVSRNTIEICTNVDWRGASFIIDDRELGLLSTDQYSNMIGGSMITVKPNSEHKLVTIKDEATLTRLVEEGIGRDTVKIDLGLDDWDGELYIVVYNSSHKVYRKYGYDHYSGNDMRDVIVLDKDGNVSSDTPIVFDYTNIDYIEVYKIDPTTAITVENGVFTTRACQYNTVTGPKSSIVAEIARGISVERSYTTLKNIKHYVTDEIALSEQVDEAGNVVYCAPAYEGFFAAKNATDILFTDLILTGRRCYLRPQGGTSGTYDLQVNMANNVIYENCVQHNFWVSLDDEYNIKPTKEGEADAYTSMQNVTINGKSLKMHWGIGRANYSKNFYYVDSILSRYDSHEGQYNGGIINTTVNYVEIIGNGTFLMDDMTYYSSGANTIIPLRADQGWTWEGDIILTDVKAYVFADKKVSILYHGYENWYFGYTCYFPNISISNLDLYNIETNAPLPEGYRVELTNSVEQLSKMHLLESHERLIYSYEDKDGDGYVDEPQIDRDLDGKIDAPYDYDGNGDPHNTDYTYDANMSSSERKLGLVHYSYANINPTVPPAYIKIVGNDGVDGSGGYVFYVTDTSGKGISDGGYYGTETKGGFYGGTKFIFGEGEGDFIIGTDIGGRTDIITFSFE